MVTSAQVVDMSVNINSNSLRTTHENNGTRSSKYLTVASTIGPT